MFEMGSHARRTRCAAGLGVQAAVQATSARKVAPSRQETQIFRLSPRLASTLQASEVGIEARVTMTSPPMAADHLPLLFGISESCKVSILLSWMRPIGLLLMRKYLAGLRKFRWPAFSDEEYGAVTARPSATAQRNSSN